jgi:hypothetical protein
VATAALAPSSDPPKSTPDTGWLLMTTSVGPGEQAQELPIC